MFFNETMVYLYFLILKVGGQQIRPAMFMTPLQLQMHQQLKAKHAELFRKIVEQQEELRKVSEQLLMTQYGLVPFSVAPVQLPIAQVQVPNVPSGHAVTVVTQPHHPGTVISGPPSALSLPARGSVPGAGNNGQTDIFGPQEMQLGYANVLSASNQSQNNSQRNRIPQNR